MNDKEMENRKEEITTIEQHTSEVTSKYSDNRSESVREETGGKNIIN